MITDRIDPDGMYKPLRGIYSQVTKATGATQVHVAGTVGVDENRDIVDLGDMAAQTAKILGYIGKSLAAAGARPEDVVRINVYTTDVDAYIREGAAQLGDLFGDKRPVSTTVEVSRLVHPDWLVEIEATAIID